VPGALAALRAAREPVRCARALAAHAARLPQRSREPAPAAHDPHTRLSLDRGEPRTRQDLVERSLDRVYCIVFWRRAVRMRRGQRTGDLHAHTRGRNAAGRGRGAPKTASMTTSNNRQRAPLPQAVRRLWLWFAGPAVATVFGTIALQLPTVRNATATPDPWITLGIPAAAPPALLFPACHPSPSAENLQRDGQTPCFSGQEAHNAGGCTAAALGKPPRSAVWRMFFTKILHEPKESRDITAFPCILRAPSAWPGEPE